MSPPTRLIDTVILIDYLRGNQDARAWLKKFSKGELLVSIVTGAELITGCRNRKEQNLLEKELSFYPMVWLSDSISQTALAWHSQFHLSHGAGFLDCLIGASAYHHGVILSTLNEKHFRPFPDLQVERPYK